MPLNYYFYKMSLNWCSELKLLDRNPLLSWLQAVRYLAECRANREKMKDELGMMLSLQNVMQKQVSVTITTYIHFALSLHQSITQDFFSVSCNNVLSINHVSQGNVMNECNQRWFRKKTQKPVKLRCLCDLVYYKSCLPATNYLMSSAVH